MKVLFKALRSSKDLVRVFNFCEAHGIKTYHGNCSISLDHIQLSETSGTINWGGYGSSFGIGKNLFNYFQLQYPDRDQSRGKTFNHVKMVISGNLKNHDVEEIVQRVEKLGGLVVQDVDHTVNLLVVGEQVDVELMTKAEDLNQVLLLDEERFSAILPAKRKARAKRKPTPTKALPPTVDKRVLSNLKKLLKSRDKHLIDQGLELLRSLASVDISVYFLERVSYTPQGEGNLIPNAIFSGTGPAQPYLNYALLGVIAYAPEGCVAAVNLKQSITSLEIVLCSTEPLAEFKNLKSLYLTGSENLEDLDGLSLLEKLEHIEFKGCCALKNLEGLLNKSLDTTVLDLSSHGELESLEGLQSMPKLKELNLEGCGELKNIDALKNLPQLEDIGYSWHIFEHFKSLETFGSIKAFACETELSIWSGITTTLKGIENFHKLIELDVDSSGLTDISALKGHQSLKKLSIRSDKLQSLKGIELLPKLEELDLSSAALKSLDGLIDLPSLNTLRLDAASIRSLDGLKDLPSLNTLRLDAASIENITSIKVLTQLKHLDIDGCSSLHSLQGMEALEDLKSISCSNCRSLTNLDGVPGSHVFRGDVNLCGCSSLQDIRALKGISSIQRMDLTGCDSIRQTEGLESTEIESLDLENPKLETLKALTNLNVKELNITNPSSLKGLKEWKSVITLEISAGMESGFKSSDGVEAFSSLEKLSMGSSVYDSCETLEDLKGVEHLKHLREMDLTECAALSNVSSIAELPNLTRLLMDGCRQVKPLPRPKVMENRGSVQKYQVRLLKALGKEPAKKPSKKRKPAVDRKTLTSVKKLVTARDVDLVNQGVELVRSLENPALYEALLDGVDFGVGGLVPNKLFNGSGPAQPYLDHAMMRLICDAPNDFALELRDKVKDLSSFFYSAEYYSNFLNLERLTLNGGDGSYSSVGPPVSTLKGLSAFHLLTRLEVREGPKEDQDLENLSSLNNLNVLYLWNCESLVTLDGLQGCHGLQSLQMDDAPRLKNLNALKGLQSLKSISISGAASLENLNGLEGCDSLEELVIDGGYLGIGALMPMKNIDALKGLKALKSVRVDAAPLENLDGLSGCVALESLDVNADSLENLDGLSGCVALESLDVNADSLENIDGLRGLKHLKLVRLSGGAHGVNKLKEVDGLLGGCENLGGFSIQSGALENLDGLKGWHCETFDVPSSPKLTNLDVLAEINGLQLIRFDKCEIKNWKLFNLEIPLVKGVEIRGCEGLKPLEGFEKLINLENVLIERCQLESLEGLEKLDKLTQLKIRDCSNLDTLDGLKGLKNLQKIILADCKSLKNVDALLKLSKLEIFKLHSCGIKKAQLPKQLQVMVETRTNYQDWY